MRCTDGRACYGAPPPPDFDPKSMPGLVEAQRVHDAISELVRLREHVAMLEKQRDDALAKQGGPIPMILTCPQCNQRHIDEGEFAERAHHTHACQNCGMVWRPAIVPTVGVRFLPGFKNE